MNGSTVATLATAIASVAAVVLSTYTLYVQRREKRPRIEVEASISFIAFGPNVSDPVVMLTAKNLGQQTATLSIPGFFLPNRMQMSIPNPNSIVQFPYEIPPDKNCQVWIDLKKFAGQLKHTGFYGEITLVGFYKDLVGRTYKSKKWKFNIDIWA